MMRRQWRLVLCLLLLISLTVCTAAPSFNPYSTLGVSKDATSDEIRRNYRKLCLKFHPDKNVQKSVKERKKCEETFKKIQKANGLIGDEEARRNYEQSQVYSFPGASSFGGGQRGPSSSNADSYSDVFRRYYEQQQRGPPPTRFYFGGVDISKMFSSGPPSFMPRSSSLKSKYIQRVKVPLQDLYRGKYGVDLPLQDVIWNRYGAAFRGGVASTLLYEALIISVSMIRVVRFPWSFLVGAVFFHAGLPKPSKLDYTVDLQAGWKAGTKLKFCEVEPGFDVVFIIEEAKHARYHRVGNDLYTTITITETQRREGCTVKIDPLDADEGLISIELEANQILNSGDRITISGMGWPGKKGKNPGDLLVSVKVTRRTKKKKTKERRAPLTKQASANSSSSSEETLEIAIATQQKSTRIEIPQESNKRPKQEYPSMEDNALSTLPAQQRRLFPRARSVSLMTPTLSLEEQRQDNSSYYQSKVPMPVVTFTSDSSFQEWSPLPFFEPVLNSSMPRPHPPYLSSNVYRNPATPFCDMSFLQASASLTFNNGSSPGPPPLMSSVSSKGFLLAQPMIQTPAPTAPKTFFSANGYPRSIVHRQMTNMTPMSENSFHPAIMFSPLTEKSVDPAMFSIDSTISGGTPYSPLRKDSVNPVLSVAAQLCEPIAVERSITTPPNAAKIKEPVTVRNGHRGTTKPASTRSTQLVQEKTPRAKSFPRLVEAAKMHARVASKRAAQEDEGDEHAEELFCTCPKSKCLKLYCVCFQRGIFCDTSACRCRTCKNTMKHDGPKGARTMAILAIEKRRDDAFGKRAKQTGLGCSCKTNKCLKKYCACYAEGNSCADKCGCVDCHNKAGPVAWFDGTPLYMEREMGSGIYPV